LGLFARSIFRKKPPEIVLTVEFLNGFWCVPSNELRDTGIGVPKVTAARVEAAVANQGRRNASLPPPLYLVSYGSVMPYIYLLVLSRE
jgi:hypothetical protein